VTSTVRCSWLVPVRCPHGYTHTRVDDLRTELVARRHTAIEGRGGASAVLLNDG
jgi:hypothetical protein